MHRISRVRSRRGKFAACVLAGALGGAVLRGARAEDRPPIAPLRPSALNLLADARLDSAVAGEDLPVPQWFSVLDASFASPIVLRTSIPHGLSDGDAVVVRGVLGNEAANGFWRVRVVSPTEVALEGSAGSGGWAGGGAFYPTAGQPRPPGPQDHAGNLLWTPWFSVPASVTAHAFFSATRTQPTGEISTLPPSPGDAFLSQELDGSLFSPGESLSLSIECRMPERPVGNQSLKLLVTALFGTQRTYQARFPATQVTSSYQRFSMAFTVDDAPIPPGSLLRVEFVHEVSSGAPAAMSWTRPMLSAGAQPPPWTGEVPSLPRSHSFYPVSSPGPP